MTIYRLFIKCLFFALLLVFSSCSMVPANNVFIGNDEYFTSELNAEIVDYDLPVSMDSSQQYLLKISLKNVGDITWNKEEIYLSRINTIEEIGEIQTYLYKDVDPGEVIDVYDIIIPPYDRSEYVSNMQLSTKENLKFGEKLTVDFSIDSANKYSDKDIEKFNLELSDNDIKHFEDLTEGSIKLGYKDVDNNIWRKAKLDYAGKSYDVEIKIHGDTPKHYLDDVKSYRVRLLGGEFINGVDEFSFIIFFYSPLINQFYADIFGLYHLYHEPVWLSVNGGDFVVYNFREFKTDDYLRKNIGENFAFIGKSFIYDTWFNHFIQFFGGYHQTFLNFEFSFNEIQNNSISKEKINYQIYLLNNYKEQGINLFDFFDYEYLINFEALRTILLTSHDVAGDNLVMLFDEDKYDFYPLVGAEAVYPYLSSNIEVQVNSEVCSNVGPNKNQTGYGEKIEVFADINSDSKFRQDKYKKVYEIVKDDASLTKLVEYMGKAYFAVKNSEIPISDIDPQWDLLSRVREVIRNFVILENELSNSKLLIWSKYSNNDVLNLIINPLSISEIKFEKFVVNGVFENDVSIKIWNDENENIFDNVEVSLNNIDISKYLSDFILALSLDERMSFFVNEINVEIDGIQSVDDIFEVDVKNTVTGISLINDEDYFVFNDFESYSSSVNDLFYYNREELKKCKDKFYNDLTGFDNSLLINENLLQRKYHEAWDSMLSGKMSIDRSVLLTLQNYNEEDSSQDLETILAYDLSLSKMFFNVVQNMNIITVEMLPISLSNMEFLNFILILDGKNQNEQKINVKLYSDSKMLIDGDILSEEGSEIDLTQILSGFQFNSDFDEQLRTKETKYYLQLTFEDNIYINDLNIELVNTVSGEKLTDGDFFIEIADAS